MYTIHCKIYILVQWYSFWRFIIMANNQQNTPSNEEEFVDDSTAAKTPTENQTVTFEQKVNTVISKMVEKDGKWELPDDITDVDEAVLYAARSEKRYRDTQGAYTKSRQKIKEIETINDRLTSHLVENATLHLNAEQLDELEELKLRDPEAWRTKLNEHESTSRQILKDKIEGFRKDGEKLSELEVRQIQYEAFTESTGIELSDEIIENQLPASYSKQLEAGTITFDQFLEKAKDFLTKDKVIKGANDTKPNSTSLNDLPGGSKPTEKATDGDIVASYNKEIY